MAQPKLSLRKTAARKAALRSPLKDKTLRNPGQSLDDEIGKAKDDIWEHGWYVLGLLLIFWINLMQWLFNIPAKTMTITTAIALFIVLVFYVPRIARTVRKLKRLRRARDGERAVAEYLDTLREAGHRVFHDIVGTGFNIDHIIVGPKGIFTIETKTLNKRDGQNVSLRFDGMAVHIGVATLPDNPVPQALAQVTWLKRTLLESTGKTFTVKPVVVFPGWFVEAPDRSEVWVLEPKMLKGFLEHEPTRLKPDDITLIAFHLKRYIRATNT